jgi:type IV pilus modification protein PilV
MSAVPPPPLPPAARSPRTPERLRGERGMTLVEVLVAIVILAVGVLAVVSSLAVAKRATTSAERSSVFAQIGEQALQSIEALPYSSVAETGYPTRTSTPSLADPTYYLSACTGSTCTAYQWDPANPASAESIDVSAGGAVSPAPTVGALPSPNGTGCTPSTPTTNCRITYEIFTFITDVASSEEPVCSQTGVSCQGAVYKRVTIAVVNTSGGPPANPVYVSTFVTNKASVNNNPLIQGATCLDGGNPVPCLH